MTNSCHSIRQNRPSKDSLVLSLSGMTAAFLVVLLSLGCTLIWMHVLIAMCLGMTPKKGLANSLQQFLLAPYSRLSMGHPRLQQKCIILWKGSQKPQNTWKHMMAKWNLMTTWHALMTSCKPGFLVKLLQMTLHYNFPLTVHNSDFWLLDLHLDYPQSLSWATLQKGFHHPWQLCSW